MSTTVYLNKVIDVSDLQKHPVWSLVKDIDIEIEERPVVRLANGIEVSCDSDAEALELIRHLMKRPADAPIVAPNVELG